VWEVRVRLTYSVGVAKGDWQAGWERYGSGMGMSEWLWAEWRARAPGGARSIIQSIYILLSALRLPQGPAARIRAFAALPPIKPVVRWRGTCQVPKLPETITTPRTRYINNNVRIS